MFPTTMAVQAATPRLLRSIAAGGPEIGAGGASVTVAKVHHPVSEGRRAAGRLLDGRTGIRECEDEAGSEVLGDLPVGIEVGFERDVLLGHRRRNRLRLIEAKVVEDQPSADRLVWLHVNPYLVRDEIGVGEEVLAGDLALPPG